MVNKIWFYLIMVILAFFICPSGVYANDDPSLAGDYFDWNVRTDRYGQPAGVFDVTPFPIDQNTANYSIKNDENPNGKTFYLGTKYYVDGGYTGGSNDGSWAHPWTSILTAVANVTAGNNTIIVRGAHDSFNGIYSETGIIPKAGIDDIHRFTITGYGQERPVIDATGSMDAGIDGTHPAALQYVTIQRFKVQNSFDQGVYFSNHSYISVIDVWMFNNDTYDFVNKKVYHDGNLYFLGVTNSWIYHSLSEHTFGHCLKVGDDSRNDIVEWSVARECGYWQGFPLTSFYGSHAAGLDFPNGYPDDSNGDGIPDRGWNQIARYNIVHTVLYQAMQLRRDPNFSVHHNEFYDSQNMYQMDPLDNHGNSGHPQVEIIEYDTYGNFYSNIIRDPGASTAVNLKVNTYNSNWEAVNIYNNLIYGGGTNSFLLYSSTSSDNTTINFLSNSVYGSTKDSLINVDLVNVPFKMSIQDNIIYQAGSGYAIDPCTNRDSSCTAQPSHTYNIFYAPNGKISRSSLFVLDPKTEMNADPVWQALPSGSYNSQAAILTSNSSALNKGSILSAYFTNDFNSTLRPQNTAWDIGAYEFKAIISGDVSGNGAVTMYDAALVLRDLAVGGTCSTLSSQQCTNAELDGQGNGQTVDSADVVAVARKALGP